MSVLGGFKGAGLVPLIVPVGSELGSTAIGDSVTSGYVKLLEVTAPGSCTSVASPILPRSAFRVVPSRNCNHEGPASSSSSFTFVSD